ncbi:hypothetical protein N0V95_001734 [Ascochyta clinopodiicola]|nr:hypothetical protein N0V95_001734 [Ascochyta clinopodiicola]
MQTPTGNGKRSDDIEEGRGQFFGSRVDVKSRDELAKRAASDNDEWDGPGTADTVVNYEGRPKKGSACGITFDALNYPKAASMWKGSYPQDITIGGKTKKPLDHLTDAYPGVRNREEEFVWLQATMNTPAKSNMWAYKGAKDGLGTLHNAEKMREYITGERTVLKGQKVEKVAADLVDRANIALLKLKALLGARMYMRSKIVSDIFKKQVEEIGKMLTAIDDELPNNPRKPTIGDKKLDPWIKKLDPWIKQDLGKRWTEYMNERFEIAHKRTHNNMDTYLALLDTKWCKGRPKSPPKSPAGSRPGTPTSPTFDVVALFEAMDLNKKAEEVVKLCGFLENVQKEWKAEKAKPWTKPW